MVFQVEYFNRRVLEQVESWPVGILADYTLLIELLMEFGPDVQMPHSRPMGGGLFERRAHGAEGAGRVLYCWATGTRVVVLHALVKKTLTTPRRDLDIARRRMKGVRGD